MSFRGIDLTPGINKYADLIRSSYEDAQRANQMIYERGARYGAPVPEYMYSDNPFYVEPQETQPQELSALTPVTGQPVEGLPPGDWKPYVPVEPGRSVKSVDPSRDPSASYGYQKWTEDRNQEIDRKREELRQKQEELANKLVEERINKGDLPTQGEMFLEGIKSQPKIHPYLLKQALDLQEKLSSKGDSALVAAINALGRSQPSYIPVGSNPPRGPSTNQRKERMKELESALDRIEKNLPDRTKSNQRAFQRWKETSVDGQKYLRLQNELDSLMSGGPIQQQSQPAPIGKTIKKIKIKGELLTKEQALLKYPDMRSRIEAAFK